MRKVFRYSLTCSAFFMSLIACIPIGCTASGAHRIALTDFFASRGNDDDVEKDMKVKAIVEDAITEAKNNPQTRKALERIAKRGEVRVGTSYMNMGPFVCYDNRINSLSGFDIEVATEVVSQLSSLLKKVTPYQGGGLKVVFSVYPWGDLFEAPNRQEVDFIIGGITIDPSREHRYKLGFSESYYKTTPAIIYYDDAVILPFPITQFSDLKRDTNETVTLFGVITEDPTTGSAEITDEATGKTIQETVLQIREVDLGYNRRSGSQQPRKLRIDVSSALIIPYTALKRGMRVIVNGKMKPSRPVFQAQEVMVRKAEVLKALKGDKTLRGVAISGTTSERVAKELSLGNVTTKPRWVEAWAELNTPDYKKVWFADYAFADALLPNHSALAVDPLTPEDFLDVNEYGRPLWTEPYGMGFDADNASLRILINAALIKSQGALDQLNADWFMEKTKSCTGPRRQLIEYKSFSVP